MFEEFIELIDLGVIRFPYEYDGRDFVKVKKSTDKDEEEFEEYELSDDEKLALINIDLMKSEITAIEKTTNKENTSVTYALSSEAVRKIIMMTGHTFLYCLLIDYMSLEERILFVSIEKIQMILYLNLKLLRNISKKGWCCK